MNSKETHAYIVGIALGDGNLSNPNGRAVRLRVSCDTVYPKLIKHIDAAIKKLLPKNSVTHVRKKDKRCIDISCYSNQWPKLLGWFPGSKESQQVRIPPWIKSSKQYANFCLRGLIETDGSIYKDRKYTYIFFTTTIRPLIEDVFEIIKMIGFIPRLYTIRPKGNRLIRYNIRITKDVKKFLSIIQPTKQ